MKLFVQYYDKLKDSSLYKKNYNSEKEVQDTIKSLSEKYSELADKDIKYRLITEEEYKSENYKEFLPFCVVKPFNDNKFKYVIFYKEIYFYYKDQKIFDNYGELIETKTNKIDKISLYAILGINKKKINKNFSYYKKITSKQAEEIIPNVFYSLPEYSGNYFAVIYEF